MKRFLFVALVLCLGFVGCDKYDNSENPKESIVGKWYLANEKGYYFDMAVERVDYDDSYSKEETWLLWEFSAGKTGILTNLERPERPFTTPVSWTVNGNKLIVNNNPSQSIIIKNVTATTLVTYRSEIDENGEWEDTTTFRKL